jgi:hypothetical protein
MYSSGYFRDPYNSWSVLWKFGLSWWTDVIPRLDDEHYLQPAQASWLRDELAKREATFAAALAGYPAERRKDFRKRYQALAAFLDEAITRRLPIRCSL